MDRPHSCMLDFVASLLRNSSLDNQKMESYGGPHSFPDSLAPGHAILPQRGSEQGVGVQAHGQEPPLPELPDLAGFKRNSPLRGDVPGKMGENWAMSDPRKGAHCKGVKRKPSCEKTPPLQCMAPSSWLQTEDLRQKNGHNDLAAPSKTQKLNLHTRIIKTTV